MNDKDLDEITLNDDTIIPIDRFISYARDNKYFAVQGTRLYAKLYGGKYSLLTSNFQAENYEQGEQ